MTLSVEQQHYEIPEIWEDAWFPQEDRERIKDLADLIPGEVSSIVDVGCGNGLFLNHLRNNERVFQRLLGIDRSEAALRHVHTDKRLASIDSLPFQDREFDLVTSHEVLEHIPAPLYLKALGEISRLSKKWIIISVPYAQRLELSLSKCPYCAARFNADFHVRSYNEVTLRDLFLDRGFKKVSIHKLGANTLRYDQELRIKFREALKGEPVETFPPAAICPVCSYSNPDALKQEIDKRNYFASAPVPHSTPLPLWRRYLASLMPTYTTHRWIAAVYERSHE